MATIEWNKRTWDNNASWPDDGEGWSESWGASEAAWLGCLLPRVFPFLGGNMLEIACGRGRWTGYLSRHCTSLTGVDVAPTCIQFCRRLFPARHFEVNDGYTLPVNSALIDFAFSLDSLVHCDRDVLESYVKELARVLKPGKTAFIHYSENDHDPPNRAAIITQPEMLSAIRQSGMSCVLHETIMYGPRLDCFATFKNLPNAPEMVIVNPRFPEERAIIKQIWSAK